jgi:hypothetical protein
MKINKVIIRILHFFGFAKTLQHSDDIKVLVHLKSDLYNQIYDDKPSDRLVELIKNSINEKFSQDKKFEINCKSVKKVWAILCSEDNVTGYGAMVKELYYDDELFYPGYDDLAFKRNMKLKELGI